MNNLLHTENFPRVLVNGKRIQGWLQSRSDWLTGATEGIEDPDVSIVIRTRNNVAYMESLFADIQAQQYNGAVEVILVDTESRDGTVALARSQGAKIVTIKQADFSYPKALNLGFQAASHPWVVSLVGHSNLTNHYFLKSLSYWNFTEANLAGVYGLPLANWNASVFERLENLLGPESWRIPKTMDALAIGIMGANCSIVKREIWQQLGGYDERYAGGGEDRDFARRMLDNKMTIVREPLCSVFHSHGLSLHNSIRQWLHWGEVAKGANKFDASRVHGRRPDLR